MWKPIIYKIHELQKALGLRLQDDALEKLFRSKTLEIQRFYLKIFNLLLFFNASYLTIVSYVDHAPKYEFYFRLSSCLCCLLAFLMTKYSAIVQEVTFILTVLSMFFFNHLEVYLHHFHVRRMFELGNNTGAGEILIVLFVQRTWLKFSLQFIILITKIVIFKFNSTVLIYSLLTLYWLIMENHMRKSFETLEKSKAKSREFELLVTQNFPTNVLIMKDDLKTHLYSNDQFNQTFYNKPELREMIFSELRSRLFTRERLNTELNYDIKEDVPFSTTAFPTSELVIEEKIDNWIFKLQRIMWNDSPAFAIIINDLEAHQKLENLRRINQYKDKLISSLSHELRTPINGIIGLIDSAVDVLPPFKENEKILADLANAKSCAMLLLHFVNSILDMNQITLHKITPNFSLFSLNKLIVEVQSLFAFQAQSKGLKFEVELAPGLPKQLLSDRKRLLQVLVSLLTNAFKFTKAGFVKLEVTLNPRDEKFITFKVKDSGLGMKPIDIEKLFTLISSLDHEKTVNSEGVGFGLTISKHLVILLNQDQEALINVESVYGIGSNFSFSIPITPPHKTSLDFDEDIEAEIKTENELIELDAPYTLLKSGKKLLALSPCSTFSEHAKNLFPIGRDFKTVSLDTMQLSPEVTEQAQSRLKCLVVDDNTFNLVAMKTHLNRIGVKAETVSSGEAAIEAVLKEQFDIIFMDIQMPVMDGLETTRLINKKIKDGLVQNVPIVALTANGEEAKESCIDNGMVDFVLKPVEIGHLKGVLEKWAKRGLKNES